ncbi:hypothetical protein [Accumulibacter sp.]|uniref:hypothetical protein n=1 Tax=Accumulibacter sp. TaxID=2053492 RepID=UPI0035B25E50
MPIVIEPRGRGRPPTHPVDRVRTKLWFNAVKRSSGLPSAYALEMTFDGERVRKRETDVARPRKWDSYEKGAVVPTDKPGPRNAVEQAEARYPGTVRWFRSPLWALLKREEFDSRRIEDALRTLEPEVVAVLFEAKPREHEHAPRQRSFDGEGVRQLLAIASFDALVAAVLLAALAEVIASPQLRERALHLYVELQAPLRDVPELAGVYPELFSLIDQRCKHWVYLSDNQRMDVVIFWQGVQADAERRKVADGDESRSQTETA